MDLGPFLGFGIITSDMEIRGGVKLDKKKFERRFLSYFGEQMNRSPEVIVRRPHYFCTTILRYISKWMHGYNDQSIGSSPVTCLEEKPNLLKYVFKNPRNVHR